MPLYYYPNRPHLVPPDPQNPLDPKPNYINGLEASGKYVAEQKWNGDNLTLMTGKSRLEFWNRQHSRLKYAPSDGVREELLRLPKNCSYNAELVHNKTKTVKHRIIVHCVMVWKGKPLLGKSWGDSRRILEDLEFGEHVVLSPVWKSGFWDLFQKADGSIIEGIILKDPNGKLVFSSRPVPDVPWMLKIRKPCKKYSF